jgi:hypothetical protein
MPRIELRNISRVKAIPFSFLDTYNSCCIFNDFVSQTIPLGVGVNSTNIPREDVPNPISVKSYKIHKEGRDTTSDQLVSPA